MNEHKIASGVRAEQRRWLPVGEWMAGEFHVLIKATSSLLGYPFAFRNNLLPAPIRLRQNPKRFPKPGLHAHTWRHR